VGRKLKLKCRSDGPADAVKPPFSKATSFDQGITKKGSKLLRWALIESISCYHGGPHLAVEFHRLADRRGKNKARVAIARRVLTLAYYGLRDGEIRCLTQPAEAA
jgi:hypothetical protein